MVERVESDTKKKKKDVDCLQYVCGCMYECTGKSRRTIRRTRWFSLQVGVVVKAIYLSEKEREERKGTGSILTLVLFPVFYFLFLFSHGQ